MSHMSGQCSSPLFPFGKAHLNQIEFALNLPQQFVSDPALVPHLNRRFPFDSQKFARKFDKALVEVRIAPIGVIHISGHGRCCQTTSVMLRRSS